MLNWPSGAKGGRRRSGWREENCADRKMETKVPFLCTSNLCRSRMAEDWGRHLKGQQLDQRKSRDLTPGCFKVKADAIIGRVHVLLATARYTCGRGKGQLRAARRGLGGGSVAKEAVPLDDLGDDRRHELFPGGIAGLNLLQHIP